FFLLSAAGCASGPKPMPGDVVDQVPREDPELPGVRDDQAPEIYGPAPFRRHPVVLVLGPGLARGFAFAGVIQALDEAGISIGGIVGTGMGALIGAIYLSSDSVNDFEWKVTQIKKEYF